MRFSGRGIGWLIAGALICCSMTEADSAASAAGTVALGFVFIAIYLMKQKFDPSGIGWFIAGGILTAFCIEEMLGVIGGFVTRFSIVKDDLSTILISVIFASGCLYMFYRSNKSELEYAGDDPGNDGSGDDGGFEFPFQEEVFKEETVEYSADDKASAEAESDIVDIVIMDELDDK